MESKKINQLATNLAPVSTDLTVIGNPTTGELKKITLSQISSLFGGGIGSIGMVVPSGFSVSPATLTANGTFTISGAGTTAQYIRGDGSLATFPSFLSSDRLIQEVRNNSGATMLKGTIVYINGAVGNKATIAKALATSDATSAQTYGVVQDDIPNNSNGYVVVIGEVTGLDTSALSDGQQLYLSGTTAGYYTTTKPYAPIHLVYVAVVLRSHPTLGVLGVKIGNGYEMDELHNVSAQSPSNNDGLFYNSTTSLWEKNTISGVLGYTPASSSLYVPYTGATTNVDLGTNNLLGKVLFIKEQTAGSFSNTSGFTAINVSDSYFSFSRSSSQRASFYYQPNAYSYTLPSSSGTLALTSDIPSLTGYVPTTRTISTTSPLSGGGDLSANRTLSITQATTSVSGYLSSTDWNTFNGKQDAITLTTTGTSGAATLVGSTLNIPQYSGTNIYNADGTLASNRIVTMAAYNLSFNSTARTSGAAYTITAIQTTRNATDTNDAALSASYTYASTNVSAQALSRVMALNLISSATGGGINDYRGIDINVQLNTTNGADANNIVYIANTTSATIITQRGFIIDSMQGTNRGAFVSNAIGGSNSTYLLIGTKTIPSGTWGIYQTESTFNNYFNGKILIGTTTDAGYNLDINGSARIQGNVVYECFQPTTTTVASTATLTPDLSLGDTFTITAQAASLSVANPTGSPVNGQKMMIRIKDNGTARAISWSGSQYRASTDLTLPSTTIVSKTVYLGFIYNSIDTKWDLIALLNNF